ncbi:MAG: GH92 family glycosyl hydrolase [Micrococcales bacterium]|nr:GH92 family glycosyl hydrolase [Micrococcales bacterium]
MVHRSEYRERLVLDGMPRREPGVAAGPSAEHAPAARAEAGYVSRAAAQYLARESGAVDVGALADGIRGIIVAPGCELHYAVLPEWDGGRAEVLHGFGADAVALDLVFSDGSRLSELDAVDQYGIALDPSTQHAARYHHPDQWNLRRVALDAAVGRTVASVELRFARTVPDDDDRPFVGWLDGLAVSEVPPKPERPAEWARTRQGTMSGPGLSRGNTLPAVAVPNGFVTGIPVTRAHDHNWLYSWHRDNRGDNRPAIEAFGISHAPSPWIGERGAFHVMPSLADGIPAGAPRDRALGFDHAGEIGQPHRYHVLLDGGIEAELTAADHTVLTRFRYPRGSRTAVLIFDQVEGTGELLLPEPGAPAVLHAWTDDAAGTRADREAPPRAYLHASIDRPILDRGMLPDEGEPRVRGTDRSAARGWVRVALDDEATVTVRMATSFIGTAQAARNLRLDGAGDPFERVQERAAEAWDDWIGRIEVEGADDEARAQLATCLYRVGLFPNRAHESVAADGSDSEATSRYASVFAPTRPRGTAAETGAAINHGELTVNHGFWDVYRTAWPLYCLLDPSTAARLLDGFAEHYRSGGWTSRWSAPGPIDSMTGTSNDVVFAHAVDAGVPTRLGGAAEPVHPTLDVWAAYESALRNATVPPPTPLTGRKGISTSAFRGWVDTTTHESVGWTLDGSINDLAVARLATALLARLHLEDPRRPALEASAEYFRVRAGAHRHSFDPRLGFYRGRDAEGRFADPDGYDAARWGGDYTETNGWGTAFSAPHDGAGLVSLLGGRSELERRLLEFVTTPERGDDSVRGGYEQVIHEMVEARNQRLGMLALSNQPAHHIPYMALFAGRPDLTQDLTRTAVERLFSGGEIGQGWPGDEDNGEMSAWWIFSAVGLYPLIAGTAGYVLTAPLFRLARLRLGDGAELVVDAPAADRAHRFIRSVHIDDEAWHSTYVPHARLAAGATITIELATEPQRWGSEPGAEPPSLTASGRMPSVFEDLSKHAVIGVPSGADGRLAFDDDSGSGALLLRAGEEVRLRLDRTAGPEMLTVTMQDPGTVAWRLECERDGGWEQLGAWSEDFVWERQLRPFTIPKRASRLWRLIAVTEMRIAQLELLCRA